MKVIATGDWHLRYTKPANRIDDYLLAQKGKVETILQTSLAESAPIFQPGDFFDTPNIPFFLLAEYIRMFQQYKHKIYVVFGQHDLRYHTLHGNTPLNLLQEIGIVKILGKEPTMINAAGKVGVFAYGASWGDEIPVVTAEPDVFKILVCHKMVVGSEKLWFDQKDFVWAEDLLQNNNYNLIISGDNHKSFFVISKDNRKLLINCGSLMRMTVDQTEHRPHFYVVDTDKNDGQMHHLPFAPFDEVMNVKKVEKEKERNTNLEAFVGGLKDVRSEMGMDFVREMETYVKENNVPDPIHQIIKESMRTK